jgi:membrane protein YqaA with SNARE-associated domain
LTTWGLGRLAALGYALDRLSKAPDARALHLAQRYGILALLFSWLPVIGDGLCLAAGWLKLSFWRSLLAILIGKLLRYAAVVWFFAR